MRWGRYMVGAAAVLVAITTGACGDGSGSGQPKPATKRFQSGASSSPGGLQVKSNAFSNGGVIPERYSCKGQNQPPPLSWSGVPSGTKGVAVVLTDSQAPSGLFVHWIVTGLPTTPTGSITSVGLPSGAKVEKNSADQAGYTGMCPPAGQTHEYVFEVLALNKAVTFPANATPVDKVRILRSAAFKSGKVAGEFGG